MTKTSPLSKLYIALVFIFLYAPMVVMMVFSFNSSESTYIFEGFSLQWYERLFHDKVTMDALKNTIVLAVTSAAIATTLGTLAAVGLNSMKNKFVKSSVMTVTNIPMMNPEIVTGISMMLLFVFVYNLCGVFKLGFTTLLISHITFCIPYVLLSVLPKLRQMNISMYEAALDLGCSPIKAFFKVVLPEIMPGILSGFLMAFTLSLDDFVISLFTGGTSQTLSVAIYSMTKKQVNPKINALSTLLFVSVLVMLILTNIIQAKADKRKGAN